VKALAGRLRKERMAWRVARGLVRALNGPCDARRTFGNPARLYPSSSARESERKLKQRKSRNGFLKKCSRRAGKWTSVSPWPPAPRCSTALIHSASRQQFSLLWSILGP
jgi:hypothetical protein